MIDNKTVNGITLPLYKAEGFCCSVVVNCLTINPEVRGSIPSLVGNFLRHLVFPTHLEVNWFETQR